MRTLFIMILECLSLLATLAQNSDLQFRKRILQKVKVTKDQIVAYRKDPKNKPRVDYIFKDAKTKQPDDAGLNTVNIDMMVSGGNKAPKNRFPWQVLVIGDDSWICGGSIISYQWILTTAYCVNEGTKFVVNAGGINSDTVEKNEQVYTSPTAIKHKDYDSTSGSNDIGLIRVWLYYNKFVKPIRLPKYSEATKAFAGVAVVVSGYGRTADAGSLSSYLLFASMKTMKNDDCAAQFGTSVIGSSVICTAANPKKSACFGDSGGPLMMKEKDGKFTVIGIVSGSAEKCVGLITIYTRVTSFLGWISENSDVIIKS